MSAQSPVGPAENLGGIEYEDYGRTSGSYDRTRVPLGLPTILGFLASTPIALSEQTVLDAGCGTGSCLAELRGRIGRLHGLELNAGMREVAERRSTSEPNVRIDQGSVTEMPYADGSFDGVICNQVLHHLDHGNSEQPDVADFPNVSSFFREAFRVLRPRGVAVINTSGHEQNRDGFWWAALIPATMNRMLRRIPSIGCFESMFQQAGLVGLEVIVAKDEVLQGDQYLDPAGPLSAQWRAGDSTWSLATEPELTDAVDKVTSMLEDGSMAAFMAEREQLRAKVGQTTFLAARKP